MKGWKLLLIGVVGHLIFQLGPTIPRVWENRSGRDFASYYYALQATQQGIDPYDSAALGKLAEAEKTRKTVNPYFYPPPFLVTVYWSKWMSLQSSYRLMLGINELLLVATLWVLAVGFEVSLPMVVLLLVAWSPIPDHAVMGQANLLALLPALLGIWWSRKHAVAGGVMVGVAGMMKMSPALFLLYFAMQRRWKAMAASVGTAVALSLAALPLVPLSQQIRFYIEILPGFGTGDYNGLTVPITLPGNHSWPDLLNRAFPGEGGLLSPTAHLISNLSLLLSLAAWMFWFRDPQKNIRQEALATGALSILMVMLPVYTYEHHLVFLLLAVGAVGTAANTRSRKIWFGICFFFLGWPLEWLRGLQHLLPSFAMHPSGKANSWRRSAFYGCLRVGIGRMRLAG